VIVSVVGEVPTVTAYVIIPELRQNLDKPFW